MSYELSNKGVNLYTVVPDRRPVCSLQTEFELAFATEQIGGCEYM